MQYSSCWRHIPLQGSFCAAQTLDCGQCFRWTEQPDGSWLGIVRGVPALVRDENQQLRIQTPEGHQALWEEYFDAQLNYTDVARSFAVDSFTAAAAEFGSGIRIVRQEPWEALCTFLISQCNNIPRIRAITERLCTAFGDPVSFAGHTLYSFPQPELLAPLERPDLEFLRAGYRSPYLIGAARAICDGTLNFTTLTQMDTDDARWELMKLNGIGRKVADCFLLFGLHKLDAFPVDTWMKKAASFYDGDFTPFIDSPFAGIYQQYIFYYARSHGLTKS